jgi:hypothetical protein
MGLKPLEGKHSVYRATIKVDEIYEIFFDKDFIDYIRDDEGSHNSSAMTIEEAVEQAVQDGWPGDWVPVSCWDEETLASNGTRSLGSDGPTEVLSVDRCKTMELKGGFPA